MSCCLALRCKCGKKVSFFACSRKKVFSGTTSFYPGDGQEITRISMSAFSISALKALSDASGRRFTGISRKTNSAIYSLEIHFADYPEVLYGTGIEAIGRHSKWNRVLERVPRTLLGLLFQLSDTSSTFFQYIIKTACVLADVLEADGAHMSAVRHARSGKVLAHHLLAIHPADVHNAEKGRCFTNYHGISYPVIRCRLTFMNWTARPATLR